MITDNFSPNVFEHLASQVTITPEELRDEINKEIRDETSYFEAVNKATHIAMKYAKPEYI